MVRTTVTKASLRKEKEISRLTKSDSVPKAECNSLRLATDAHVALDGPVLAVDLNTEVRECVLTEERAGV